MQLIERSPRYVSSDCMYVRLSYVIPSQGSSFISPVGTPYAHICANRNSAFIFSCSSTFSPHGEREWRMRDRGRRSNFSCCFPVSLRLPTFSHWLEIAQGLRLALPPCACVFVLSLLTLLFVCLGVSVLDHTCSRDDVRKIPAILISTSLNGVVSADEADVSSHS